MGRRGPGAGRLKQARDQTATRRKRTLPWKRKGLDRVGRVIAFLEFLPITKGILAGRKMKLLPDQREFIEDIYGKSRKRVRIGIDSKPRGNGKTGMVAGLALCHLLGPEAEVRGEVYSAAVDRGQAAKVFAEMEAIILAVPEFAERVNIVRFHKQMEVLEGEGEGSIYEALSSDARKGHSLAPSLWIYDELAQVRDRELLDNLETAMGKRRRSLGLIISTQAASDDHALSEMIDDGLTGADPSIVVHLLAAPEAADPFDESVIAEVNPALGIYLNREDVLAEASKAQRIPAFEPVFRNRRLNQRVEAGEEDRLTTVQVWKQGVVPIDLERLEGRPCYGGLDLSSKHDLTALVLAFPDDQPDPHFDIVPFFWTPEGQIDARRPAERDRFKEWIRQDLIIPVRGVTIRYRHIVRKLAELNARFDIRAIGFDRWRIDDLKADLADEGVELPLQPFGQGFKDMSPAIEFFTECALTERLRHGGHPVLTASVANAIVVHDPAGNDKLDKPKSQRRGPVRIDGAVATVMALGTARRFEASRETPPTSPWDDPDYKYEAA